jgi:hypothetical protein
MKSAKNFIKKYPDFNEFGGIGKEYVIEALKEFAKLHVKAALEKADDMAEICVIDANYDTIPPTPVYGVESNSILKAYPLNNIK